MMYRLGLENFKKFQNMGVDLSPRLIALVGPNSAGKSSLIKSLLAFKQTWEDQSAHTGFLSRGPHVDIRPYSEYVRNHDTDKNVHFSFYIDYPRPEKPAHNMPTLKKARIEIIQEFDPQTSHGRIQEYNFYILDEFGDENNISESERTNKHIKYYRMQKSEEAYKIDISRELYEHVLCNVNPETAYERRMKGIADYDTINKYSKDGAIQASQSTELGMSSGVVRGSDLDVQRAISLIENFITQPLHGKLVEELTEQTFALAALREAPQRSSLRTDESRVVGSRGENTASVFLNLRQRAVKAGKRQAKVREDYERLIKWIEDLKLGANIEVSKWRDLVDLRISNSESEDSQSIVDMGVGLSQALPILVQLAVMPEQESRLILEQPELHLYPWAQSEIGKLLCSEAHRSGNQMILETHSEHIIHGIQAHVSRARPYGRSCALGPEDIAILYVDFDRSIKNLRLDKNGEFEEKWPEGFFDQGINVLQEIIRNKSLPNA